VDVACCAGAQRGHPDIMGLGKVMVRKVRGSSSGLIIHPHETWYHSTSEWNSSIGCGIADGMKGLTLKLEPKVDHPYASCDRYDRLLPVPNGNAGSAHE
jgi:hypothetical protein